MPAVTTYTHARQALARLCDQVAATQEPVVIRRRNNADVAVVATDETDAAAPKAGWSGASLARAPARNRQPPRPAAQ